MSALPIIDPAAVESLRTLGGNDNGAFLREIIGIFLADTPERIAVLKQALAAGDRDGVLRAAHSIKGSAGSLGVSALHSAARRLEADAPSATAAELAAGASVLSAEFERARVEFQRILTV